MLTKLEGKSNPKFNFIERVSKDPSFAKVNLKLGISPPSSSCMFECLNGACGEALAESSGSDATTPSRCICEKGFFGEYCES